MKHEQLLVQYGMVRVGGQKMMEYKIESEQLADRLRESEATARSERDHYDRELGFLKKHLRQAELEIEGKNQEIAALREKVRMLELISRNAITNESIEHQFFQVFDKRLELEEMEATSSDERRRKMAALDELLKSGFRARPDEDPTDQ
jgi:chromosome segregation ATPase